MGIITTYTYTTVSNSNIMEYDKNLFFFFSLAYYS